ncbi:RidA family protein [Candidatus Bipolaricaulota bacterium]
MTATIHWDTDSVIRNKHRSDGFRNLRTRQGGWQPLFLIAGDTPTRETPCANLPFSRCVTVDRWIYLSGVVGRDPQSGFLNCQSIREQVIVALCSIKDTLCEVGACLEDIVKVTLFVTDLTSFDVVNKAYREAFTSTPPARTCVEVSRLPDPEAEVEIDVIAYRQRGK